MNAFLTAQVRDPHAVLDAMVDALWSGRDTAVLTIEPEPLRTTPAEVPVLEWRPGGGRAGDGDDEWRPGATGSPSRSSCP